MTDTIQERLRSMADWDIDCNDMILIGKVLNESADEIESLRQQLEDERSESDILRAENKDLRSLDAHAEKTIERLRSQLAEKDKRIEELKLEMEPWVRAMGLLTMMKGDLEIDAEHPGLMAREIFKWVAAKDKRIEELEDASILDVITFGLDQMNRGHDKYYIITDEQIGAAWEYAQKEDTTQAEAEECLSLIGIITCEECGGGGNRTDLPERMCKGCHGHGWISKERGDE